MSRPAREPPNHIEIDHGEGAGERINRLLHVMSRAQQPQLFAAEGNEHHRPGRRRGGQPCCYLDERGYSRGIIVGAVVNPAGAVGIQAAEPTESQMIVVSAENDRLIPQHGISARQNPDHILSEKTRLAPRRRSIATYVERLEPASCGRLKSHLGKSAGQVGGC